MLLVPGTLQGQKWLFHQIRKFEMNWSIPRDSIWELLQAEQMPHHWACCFLDKSTRLKGVQLTEILKTSCCFALFPLWKLLYNIKFPGLMIHWKPNNFKKGTFSSTEKSLFRNSFFFFEKIIEGLIPLSTTAVGPVEMKEACASAVLVGCCHFLTKF